MAEKSEKKEVEVAGLEIGALIAVVVIIAAWPSIVEYLQKIFDAFGGQNVWIEITKYSSEYSPTALSYFKTIWSFIFALSFPVSLFFLIGIIYCVEQLKHIRKREAEKYDVKVEPAYEENIKSNNVLAERWDRVQKFIISDSSNDWRQAILEADIMLDDVLTSLGYRGEGIGEKLKRVELGDMKTRQDAWDAHLVRNRVAHDGAEYPLTQLEAQKTINQYKKVFEEFYYI